MESKGSDKFPGTFYKAYTSWNISINNIYLYKFNWGQDEHILLRDNSSHAILTK